MKTLFLKTVILLCVTLAFSPFAIANDAGEKTLDAKAAKTLTSDRMWHSKNIGGEGFYSWSWKSDGSVCLRENEDTGKCLDTGTWKLKNDRLCYELTWWGASDGFKSNCFRIEDKGKGHYGWLRDNGISVIEFSVAK
jgi:hypothetical protein